MHSVMQKLLGALLNKCALCHNTSATTAGLAVLTLVLLSFMWLQLARV